MKIDFSDMTVFENLEDKAIDGQLDYDDFPPEEYKYFSKLSKLGYLNRHNGWDIDICQAKQDEYRTKYSEEKAHSNRFVAMFRRINDGLLKVETLVTQMYKAQSEREMLDVAIQIIEKLTDENGFEERINKKLRSMKQ